MEIDSKICRDCGLCVTVCSTNSIDIKTHSINHESCFLCYQCMAVCPYQAIREEGRITADISNVKNPQFFENMVHRRRTHRSFSDKLVPRETIERILNLIKYSPTGTNSQLVHVTVVEGIDNIKHIGSIMMKFFMRASGLFFNALFYPFWRLIWGKKTVKKRYSLREYFPRYLAGEDILAYDAPCLFLFHAPKARASTPEQDCIIAGTLALFYAEELGLGTCFNGFMVYGINFNRRIKKFIKLPQGHKIYCAFLAGYPEVSFQRNVIRDNLKVTYIE